MPLPLPGSPSSSAPLPNPHVDETLTLIPGLPNDLAGLVLSYVPYSHQSRLKLTCKSWYTFLSSESPISLRYKHNCLSHLLCIFPQDPCISSPYLFDPENFAWLALPPMPCNPYEYGLCNFTSVALGPHLYVLGGSHFDARSFPLDRPMPSSSAFRYNFLSSSWERLASMLSPRGSFACGVVPDSDQIIVAGGGSRHTLFGAAGSRLNSVERYDVGRDEWVALDGLPRFRAGCVGFFVRDGGEREFWVMGGYGESRTVLGVLPVDEYYKDAVVMELKNNGGGKWREVGDMWRNGERSRLGKIVVVQDGDCSRPAVFMLDENDIFRYDMASNQWRKECSVPRKAPFNKSFGFAVLKGELHVMTVLHGVDSMESRRSRQQKKAGMIYSQIYHPMKKTWRSLVARPPFSHQLDFSTAVVSAIQL